MPEISALAILGYVYLSLLVFSAVTERWLGHKHTEWSALAQTLFMDRKAVFRRRVKRREALGFEFAI